MLMWCLLMNLQEMMPAFRHDRVGGAGADLRNYMTFCVRDFMTFGKSPVLQLSTYEES